MSHPDPPGHRGAMGAWPTIFAVDEGGAVGDDEPMPGTHSGRKGKGMKGKPRGKPKGGKKGGKRY